MGILGMQGIRNGFGQGNYFVSIAQIFSDVMPVRLKFLSADGTRERPFSFSFVRNEQGVPSEAGSLTR
jgi:hypothetical protein